MSWQELGERIRELREERGLSREALAKETGVSAVYLEKLEAGNGRRRRCQRSPASPGPSVPRSKSTLGARAGAQRRG